MSKSKTFHCIVDDTALITNISEIETWVLRSVITLVVPLHTLERLHVLKKDSSQIGQNARKAVKFLDDATSNPEVKVLIQEPDDQYPTWAQVEAHYIESNSTTLEKSGDTTENSSYKTGRENAQADKRVPSGQAGGGKIEADRGQLPQLFTDKVNISKENNTSPLSTPPLSPSSSGAQSSKTSPEVKSASIITHDLSPVPPTLKGLINSVVWYTHEKSLDPSTNKVVFLTNSSDSAYLARDFGVESKTIHQLRAAIGVEEKEAKNHDKYQKKHGTPNKSKVSSEPKTLFRYEDEESDEEEVVFKPRGRGALNRTAPNTRGGTNGSVRSKGQGHGHSPASSLNGVHQPVQPSPPAQPKPQIPTEEIDPDSFDRGGFARGSTPLVSVGNHTSNAFNGVNRGPQYRGGPSSGGGSTRAGYQRGGSRGFDRGSTRGRGRLFVP